MEATEALLREHRVVERFADSLEVAARRLEAGEPVRAGFFLESADVIKGFVDACHHNKEEKVLFPALEAAGTPELAGMIAQLLAEHEEGRQLTHDMRTAAEKLEAGDIAAMGLTSFRAKGYVDLVRRHVAKEDAALFPLAEKIIQGEQRVELARAFEQLEKEEMGEGVHERYLRVVEALEKENRG